MPAHAGRLGTRTFDDGYVDVPQGAEFVLSGGTRRMVVRFDGGFAAAQVFAPAVVDVVCFEPMTSPTNALTTGDRLTMLEPGGRYTATFSITVERRTR
jgi:aldose 1-epimerase